MSNLQITRYSKSIVILHWISTLLLFVSFGLGYYLQELPPEEKMLLPHLHGLIGNVVLILTILRVYFRWKEPGPAPVKTYSKWKDKLIKYTHIALYIAITLVCVSGLSAAIIKNREFNFLLKGGSEKLYQIFLNIHSITSTILLVLIFYHALGVLQHIYVTRENVLNRITFPFSFSKKKTFTGVALLSFLLLFFYWFNFSAARIEKSQYSFKEPTQEAYPQVPVQFSIFQTGIAHAPEKLVFRAGNFSRKRTLSHIAVWVKHPKGSLLFDTGLGDSVDIHFEEMPLLPRLIINYQKGKSVRQQLLEAKIDTDTIQNIVMSHLHWDHASGIKDFPKATVWVDEAELTFACGEEVKTPPFIPKQYEGSSIKWKNIPFSPKAYLCFEESYDFFGDGSIVFVRLGGHTAGSVGMFLNLANGKKFFFTGDITWVVEGFKELSPKHRLPSSMVDKDPELIKENIFKIHQLLKADLFLTVVPSHDYHVQQKIKHFPEFEH